MSGSSIDNSYSNLSSATTTPYTQTTLTTTTSTISDKIEYEKVNENANGISDNSSLIQIQKLNEVEKVFFFFFFFFFKLLTFNIKKKKSYK